MTRSIFFFVCLLQVCAGANGEVVEIARPSDSRAREIQDKIPEKIFDQNRGLVVDSAEKRLAVDPAPTAAASAHVQNDQTRSGQVDALGPAPTTAARENQEFLRVLLARPQDPT